MNDSNRYLELLIDERAIIRQLHSYCRGMDRCDRTLCQGVFHSNAIVDYGDKMYQGTAEGFIDWTFEIHATLRAHMHRVTNILIEVNGSKAGSESYVHTQLRSKTMDNGAVDLYNYGRYLDRWEKRDGLWAISYRRYVHEMGGENAVEGDHYGSHGERNTSDESYRLL